MGFTNNAIYVLIMIANQLEGFLAIFETSSIPLIPSLLRLISTSPKCKENCVTIFLSLCCNGRDKIVINLSRLPSLMHSLYNLLTFGTPREKTKSRSLLRLLQGWEPSGSPKQFSHMRLKIQSIQCTCIVAFGSISILSSIFMEILIFSM